MEKILDKFNKCEFIRVVEKLILHLIRFMKAPIEAVL